MSMRNEKKNERSNVKGVLRINAKSTFDVDHSQTLAELYCYVGEVGNMNFESFGTSLNDQRS